MAVKELDVESLRIDGGTQLRAKIDQATVDEYREAWVNEAKFPPLIVYHDGADYWLAGGFHRYHGAKAACVPTVPCEVRKGTLREAVLFAAGDNATNGLRRTDDDKRKAVKTLLDDEEWGKRADNWIAEQCAVSNHLVAKVRDQLGKFQVEEKRVGKDGKVRSVPKKKAEPKPEPAKANGKPPGGTSFNPAEWDEPAEPKPVKDREGTEVPDHLHAVAESTWRADTVKLLNKLVEEAKKNAIPPGGMWMDIEKVVGGLNQARNSIINSQFYAVCPSCGGAKKGCGDCRKSGWVPRWRIDEMKIHASSGRK